MKKLRLEKMKWLVEVTVLGCIVFSKIYVDFEPVTMTLIGHRVFACLTNSVKM